MRTTQGTTVKLKNYKAPDYLITHVDLDFQLESETTRVKSQLMIERQKGVDAVVPLVLDGEELTLCAISINGEELDKKNYKLGKDTLTIKKLPKAKNFELEIETQINPTANTQLSGLYRSGGNYCTQCEAEGFRRITYFLDRPDVLAVFTTRIEADKKDNPILLGNGNPVKKGSAGKGRHYAVWHDPHPKPAYLFALVGGHLGSIFKPFKTVSGRKVKLGIYVEPGKEDSADYAMDALIRSMEWDEEVFGREYDLDVFNIVAISDFNMGAMENKGLNVFNDKYVLANPDTATDADYENIERIIAHEYFHNWTGNRITCRDWFQLCLKEGLTVYRDQEFTSDERSRTVQRINDVRTLKAYQFPEDAGPLAHPVRPKEYQEINNFYTTTIYQKGAEVIRMLTKVIGKDKFQKGMDIYFKRHDGEATTIEAFLACFEKAAKTDLTQFARWYSQAGTPILKVTSKYDAKAQSLTLEIEQHMNPTPGQAKKQPMVIPQEIGFIGKDGSELVPSNIKGADINDGILSLDKRKHKILFEGISSKPILSLNRGFTAPVNIEYKQSLSDLAFLANHDSDEFGRWQAFQTYAGKVLVDGVKAAQKGKPFKVEPIFLEITKQIALDEKLDPMLRATTLQLPTEMEIGQMIGKNINPDVIAKVRKKLTHEVGKSFEDIRVKLLKSVELSEDFSPIAEEAGKRGLVATLDAYGVHSGSPAALKSVVQRYKKSTNMAQRAAAFSIIVHLHPEKEVREKVLADFYKRYHDDHIVLDKWFAVQASRQGPGSIATIKSLMKHKDFSLTNPNRMRSVIAVFCMGNPTGFNAENGKGYELIADTIIKLDKINAQVAARMLTGFRSWRNYDAPRRKGAQNALKRILSTSGLSKDVTEILELTLAKAT